MKQHENLLIKELLSNLRIEIHQAGHIRCPNTWRDINYIPDYNKFYLIEDGLGWLRIGQQEYNPQPGQMFLMPQGVKQSYSYTDKKKTFLKYWVHYTATIGDVNLFDFIKTPVFINIKDFNKTAQIFKRLEQFYNYDNNLTSNLKVKACMYELIALFLEECTLGHIQIRKGGEIQRLKGVLEYIDDNLKKNLTIKDLAEVAFLHPNYFIRIFKNHIGDTPINYINKKRLVKAKELLRTKDMPIKEVAMQVGFPNTTYFFKMFKKNIGLTPNEYRNAFNKSVEN